jgi:hypothetical protein
MRVRIVVPLLAVVAVLTGCGSSSSSNTVTTVTATAPAGQPSTATAPATGATSSSSEGVPTYQPSSVVSQAPHSLVISTPDSLSKVSAYYSSTFGGGGWTIVSKTVTPRRDRDRVVPASKGGCSRHFLDDFSHVFPAKRGSLRNVEKFFTTVSSRR